LHSLYCCFGCPLERWYKPVTNVPGGASFSQCRGANITLFSPLPRVNQLPTQFFRVDFHGLTAEKNPIYLFNLTGAKQ
jgi:hypothetical protein